MELKGYQQINLNALDRYLSCVDTYNDAAKGFYAFWQTNNPPVTPFPGTTVEPYKDNVRCAPHICLKVPTGGGKTFIASAALKVAMEHINPPYKVVVWLVPSNAILEQTLRNLRNTQHPYRQRIDTDFAGRVEVFDKQQVLMGQGFSLTMVRENLCILVMSFDSFRTANKDGRKVYQDNGYLQSFAGLPGAVADEAGEIQLMSVLQALHPVVIVDESHNAVSKLSEQMLNDLHPSLVLDLTATPRTNSNVICYTDALELKRCNMVKLPVIVYNHSNKAQVIDSALHLQRSLEETAKKQKGRYIRPIVLFQAESKQTGTEDRATFEKIKQNLLDLRIPEEQIKIKTAEIDELKGHDLMSPACPVRYIITINALKEGWDCPFAYILASLADKSSSVDVEQIVGRVLRLPYASRNTADVLNLSYVLTASAKFQETLQNVVKGLNHAGFSDRDYRAFAAEENLPSRQETPLNPSCLFPDTTSSILSLDDNEVDMSQITFVPAEQTMSADETEHIVPANTGSVSVPQKLPAAVAEIINNAQQEAHNMDEIIKTDESMVAPELAPAVKTATIQSIFSKSASEVILPKFFVPNDSPQGCLFGDNKPIELRGEHLLKNFQLSRQAADITFTVAESNMYAVDINEQTDDHTPQYRKVQGQTYAFILDYIRRAGSFEKKIRLCSQTVADMMGKMIPLTQKDIQQYVARIFETFNEETLEDFMRHLQEYTQVIKDKIIGLEDNFKAEEFRKLLDTDRIELLPAYHIPVKITLKSPVSGIPKMLHTKEDDVNGFESEVINDVANLENVEWWTRNVEKKDFFINGFINHYPDFIIHTKSGKTVLLETKGDHLDAEKKIRLGRMWANKAGKGYRYCLVYKNRRVENAYTKDEFIDMLRQL